MLKITLTLVVTATMFVLNGLQEASAQVVTTYYAPAPAVTWVPVRRGLFGQRLRYEPVVTGVVSAPVTTVLSPVAEPAWSQTVTSYYAPSVAVPYAVAPAQTVAPVTLYYAPTAVPVTTYYGYRPVIYYR